LRPIAAILPPVTPEVAAHRRGARAVEDLGVPDDEVEHGSLHDDLLLDDIALDPADEERAVGVQRLHFRRAGRGFERGLVVEPQLGDAVDLDVRSPECRRACARIAIWLCT
jgi:hypothetical protein